MSYKIVIVGGGISGLATAYNLSQAGMEPNDIAILEARDTIGGNIQTIHEGDLVIDQGPNGFLDNAPATLNLIRKLGLNAQLLPSDQAAARRFIYRNGLKEIQPHPFRFLQSGILPWTSTMRIALEPLVKRRQITEETVYDFARRRIGKAAADNLVDAMVAGVFAGKANELELQSAFPKMYAMEQQYGSLVKAMIAKKRAKKTAGGPAGPAGTLTSFTNGFDVLPRTLGQLLHQQIHLNHRVREIRSLNGGYGLTCDSGQSVETETLILACPAHAAAPLLNSLKPTLGAPLQDIPYPPVSVVVTTYDNTDWQPPVGFGFLVPSNADKRILGSLWSSAIWPGRTPDSTTMFRTMVGGARQPQLAQLDDNTLLQTVNEDLTAILGKVPPPTFSQIFRYQRAIAQYTPGHQRRLSVLEQSLSPYPNLHVAGSSYRGISVNHCIEEAEELALKITTTTD